MREWSNSRESRPQCCRWSSLDVNMCCCRRRRTRTERTPASRSSAPVSPTSSRRTAYVQLTANKIDRLDKTGLAGDRYSDEKQPSSSLLPLDNSLLYSASALFTTFTSYSAMGLGLSPEITRKVCYRKDNRAMRPINVWASFIFLHRVRLESSSRGFFVGFLVSPKFPHIPQRVGALGYEERGR